MIRSGKPHWHRKERKEKHSLPQHTSDPTTMAPNQTRCERLSCRFDMFPCVGRAGWTCVAAWLGVADAAKCRCCSASMPEAVER